MLLPLLFAFFAGFALILGFLPVRLDNRPKLAIEYWTILWQGLKPPSGAENKKRGPMEFRIFDNEQTGRI